MYNGLSGIVRDKNLNIIGEAISFTPSCSDDSGNTGSTGFGSYSLIGNICVFSFFLNNIDTTGLVATDDFFIKDLPFTVKDDGIAAAPLSIAYDTINVNGGLTVAPRLVRNTSTINFRRLRDNSSDVAFLVSDITSGVSDIWISGFSFIE